MTTLKAASLIISSRNRPALLSDALASVLAGDEVPAEVVIVDQSDERHPDLDGVASSGPTRIVYLWSAERGLSRGRNLGIRTSSHPILLFTDDDCLVAPNWFATITRALIANGERHVVTGRVDPGQQESAEAFVPSIIEDTAAAEYGGRIGRDVLFTGNMAIHRRAFDEVGLFDPRLGAGARFPGAEDNDFGFRLLEAGYRIVYEPRAVVVHRAWRSPASFLALRRAYGRGQGAYFAKHLDLNDRYMLGRLGASLSEHLLRLRWVRRDRSGALGNLVYVIGMIGGALEWLLTQRRPRRAPRDIGGA